MHHLVSDYFIFKPKSLKLKGSVGMLPIGGFNPLLDKTGTAVNKVKSLLKS